MWNKRRKSCINSKLMKHILTKIWLNMLWKWGSYENNTVFPPFSSLRVAEHLNPSPCEAFYCSILLPSVRLWVPRRCDSRCFCCENYSCDGFCADLCVCVCRDAKITAEVIKVTRLQKNPSAGPEQGWCHRHSLQLQLWEVRGSQDT